LSHSQRFLSLNIHVSRNPGNDAQALTMRVITFKTYNEVKLLKGNLKWI